MFMKILPIIPIIFIIATTACFAGPSEAQVTNRTFKKTIVITSREIRIDSLLKTFSRQTGAEFSFNSNKISPSKKLPVASSHQTLSQWLDVLRSNMGVQHKIMGNHIILVENGGAAPVKPSSKKTGGAKIATRTKPVPSHTKQVQTLPVSEDKPAPHGIDTVIKTPAVIVQPVPAKPATQPTPVATATKPIPPKPATPPIEEKTIERSLDNRQVFQGMAGYSEHGSGDMKGIVFGASYTYYLSKKFSLNYELRGTIHSDKDEFTYVHQPSGTTTDASVRFTTAGIQLGVNAQLSIVRSLQHEVIISLGAFGRYQSASNGSDGYSTFPETVTGLPVLLIGYDIRTPQNTFSPGGLLQLQYNFTFRNNLFVGVAGGLQTDTNGDLILQTGLSIGRRF
jgi:hypothetical protein